MNWELAHAYETLNLHRSGGAAKIELNRPQALNAWTVQLGEELREAIDGAAGDPEVRAVVLTGAGRAFSSGADLRQGFEPASGGHPDVHGPLTDVYHPIMVAIREMPKPVLAAVNGPAVGIGCSLALCCDLVVAAESAYFLLAFVNIGLVPDGGSSLFVPARAGFGRAMEMAMLGERVPAPQAVEWGLANRVWPDAEFAERADALAERLATGPTRSYAGTKRQLNRWVYAGIEDQLALEADIQQEMAASGDFVEGVTSFVAKRAPRFSGA
jgi:2-(1,2-epoxy-1,2-dihydrophenyl)acetyl-CoA isomerase